MSILLPVASLLALSGLFWTLAVARRHSPTARARTARLGRDQGEHADIAATARELAALAWGSREDAAAMSLLLEPRKLETVPTDQVVQLILTHIRYAAKGLSTPALVPRLEVVPVPGAAGLFEVIDGWVRIQVDPFFFRDPEQARAILCHEVCHYLLSANGIRKQPTQANERLTDVAMFVLGLGDVFLAGYRTRRQNEYRNGHRLGYLSDAEYAFLHRYVPKLRTSGWGLRSQAELAASRLATMIPDRYVRERLLTHARTRLPHLDEAALVERVTEDYARDRR